MLKISKDVLAKTNKFFIPKRSPEIKRNGCVKKEMRNLECIKFMFEKIYVCLIFFEFAH